MRAFLDPFHRWLWTCWSRPHPKGCPLRLSSWGLELQGPRPGYSTQPGPRGGGHPTEPHCSLAQGTGKHQEAPEEPGKTHESRWLVQTCKQPLITLSDSLERGLCASEPRASRGPVIAVWKLSFVVLRTVLVGHAGSDLPEGRHEVWNPCLLLRSALR